MKKTWIEPELIALVRSDRQELMLSTCKTGIALGSGGPNDWDTNCKLFGSCGDDCYSTEIS